MRDIARDELLQELRALRPEFEREGVRGMVMFGSRARGDNRPDSDVDLIVEIEPGRKFSTLDAIGVGHIVEDHLGLDSNILTRSGVRTDPKFEARAKRDEIQVF